MTTILTRGTGQRVVADHPDKYAVECVQLRGGRVVSVDWSGLICSSPFPASTGTSTLERALYGAYAADNVANNSYRKPASGGQVRYGLSPIVNPPSR